jgi:hypothetical protein
MQKCSATGASKPGVAIDFRKSKGPFIPNKFLGMDGPAIFGHGWSATNKNDHLEADMSDVKIFRGSVAAAAIVIIGMGAAITSSAPASAKKIMIKLGTRCRPRPHCINGR